MEKFSFSYKKTSIHIVLLIVLGIMSAGMLVIAFKSLAVLYGSSGADRFVAGWLAAGFGLAGTAFLGFAIWYFFLVHNFFKKNEWFGVEITDHEVKCRYFDFLSYNYWETPLADVISFRHDSYKGRVFVALKTAKREFVIPLNYLDLNSRGYLIRCLSQKIKKQA